MCARCVRGVCMVCVCEMCSWCARGMRARVLFVVYSWQYVCGGCDSGGAGVGDSDSDGGGDIDDSDCKIVREVIVVKVVI